jgi:hypothetical protein
MHASTPEEIAAQPEAEPRWPVIVALLAAAALHFVLPSYLVIGPPWMVLTTVAALILAATYARHRGLWQLNEMLGFAALGVLTVGLLFGIGALLWALPRRLEAPAAMLRSASVLWLTNMLVFAGWYWRLDAGGPNARDSRSSHLRGAFLFPQMMMPDADAATANERGTTAWRPGFVDYLFLAFNTSTAFSPTDVPVLSRWAKLMMMLQALISLTTVVVIAARAVNIL